MRSRTIPSDAEVIRTYDELGEFRVSYFNGELYFLVVIGRPGLMKSWDFEESCKPRKDRDGIECSVACYSKGNITPIEAYQLAFANRNKLLVFDDAERLWADPAGRVLLRDLTETKPHKLVSWRTANKILERLGIPKSFLTSSRVCLIMNRFAFGDAHEYDAIADRGHILYFDPTPLEIHKRTAVWFWDQDIHDFIGEHLHILDPAKFSARTYVKAWERRCKGDWKEFLARHCFKQSSDQLLLALENDPRYRSVEERVAEFVRTTGLGRSTYFNLKKTVTANGQLKLLDVPRFTLTARPPDVPDLEAEARAAAEQELRRADQERIDRQEEQEYRDLENRYFNDDEQDEENDDEQ